MSASRRLKDKLNAVRAGTPDVVIIETAPAQSVSALDFGRPVFINSESGPIEYLASRRELATDKDIAGIGGVRYHTALRLRELIEGAQVKNLRSPSLEGGGGGSGIASSIPGYKLDCMAKVAGVRESMPKPWVYEMLLQVVYNDEWLDLKCIEPTEKELKDKPKLVDKRSKTRFKSIETLCWAIDIAAVSLGYLDEPTLHKRWTLPKRKPSSKDRRRSQETTA